MFTWADGEMVVLFPDVESQRDGTGLGEGGAVVGTSTFEGLSFHGTSKWRVPGGG